MPKVKHSARKEVTGGIACPSRRGGSDDSQEHARAKKRVAPPRSPTSDSSSEESDFVDELTAMEREDFGSSHTAAPKPGTRRPTFKPPPPPVQPQGDARHISLEPPLSHGRKVK